MKRAARHLDMCELEDSVRITKDSGAPATARRASTTRKTSLYRLRCSGSLAQEKLSSIVLARYLDRNGFTSHSVDQDGIRGLLISGTVAPGWADWCDRLSTLTGQPVNEETGPPAAFSWCARRSPSTGLPTAWAI